MDAVEMTSQPHLQMINPTEATQDLVFTLFSRLPQELRLKIWQFSLQRQRIITLQLENQGGNTGEEAGENPESTKYGERYFTTVDGTQVLSKLLRVNKESREEAFLFYRVHLPCTFTGSRTASHGTFHYNPEWDFLYISSEWPEQDFLIDFLYRLKTIHDPRYLGLLNLAIDRHNLKLNIVNDVQPSDLDVEVRSAFVETLRQLREVWFVSAPRFGRQLVGVLSGLGTPETRFNRSFLIITMQPAFDRISRDPRHISSDLEKTTGLYYMKDVVQLWHTIQQTWSASKAPINYQLLLGFDPTMNGHMILDHASADIWLCKEDDQWNARVMNDRFLKDKKVKWPNGAEAEAYKDEDLDTAVGPAFGFWLYPIMAMEATGSGKGH